MPVRAARELELDKANISIFQPAPWPRVLTWQQRWRACEARSDAGGDVHDGRCQLSHNRKSSRVADTLKAGARGEEEGEGERGADRESGGGAGGGWGRGDMGEDAVKRETEQTDREKDEPQREGGQSDGMGTVEGRVEGEETRRWAEDEDKREEEANEAEEEEEGKEKLRWIECPDRQRCQVWQRISR